MSNHDSIYLKHFKVPIVVVFTKYDQFLCNVEMDVLDYPDKYPEVYLRWQMNNFKRIMCIPLVMVLYMCV
jgi:hypothetical protein